ncbi:MAG: hypothetical protein H6677_22625 [Candidatus Obscuribacterales bacterium]|nr:hypothetical protein [Cyanobacteria bacterium HKST-UBA01]MCB9471086.1 hypothetical protein [Candidatus Obscuribacterales bacterium]
MPVANELSTKVRNVLYHPSSQSGDHECDAEYQRSGRATPIDEATERLLASATSVLVMDKILSGQSLFQILRYKTMEKR